jgi:malonyl CoA-acyl carrier protein transacylase
MLLHTAAPQVYTALVCTASDSSGVVDLHAAAAAVAAAGYTMQTFT